MSSSQQKQTKVNKKKLYKYKKCSECGKKRKILDGSHQLCYICYNIKTILKPEKSGNKIVDDFIRYTQSNRVAMTGKMEFVPYDQFRNVKFIAEGGFSKIYMATWVDGPVNNWYDNKPDGWNIFRDNNYTVVLKKLNNSKNTTSEELNELKVFYQVYSDRNVLFRYNIVRYFGITQDPITKDFVIIMNYYESGDLKCYISNGFYGIDWEKKLRNLRALMEGLKNIHNSDIIHKDLHSGNIFFSNGHSYIGDLGISKSATESSDNNGIYGIIPYMAPELFQERKYTKASDIYSFGMIMWEFMTGRRPFWDRNHDTELLLEIFYGLRPPIVTNAPEGYIELMKECWHSEPNKRPTATDLLERIDKLWTDEWIRFGFFSSTEITRSLDIGPATTNPGAIYRSRSLSDMSRSLSDMISFELSLRSSRSLSINLETDKRKFEDLVTDNDDDGQCIKRKKLCENEINDMCSSPSMSSSGSHSRSSSFARMHSLPPNRDTNFMTDVQKLDERLLRRTIFLVDKFQIPICQDMAKYMARL